MKNRQNKTKIFRNNSLNKRCKIFIDDSKKRVNFVFWAENVESSKGSTLQVSLSCEGYNDGNTK